jgi:hypothetical protein
MPSARTPKKTSKASTLTIRIDERLKYDVIAIARESGEDISTWIRRFFEGIRTRKGLGKKPQGTGDDEGTFTPEFIDDVLAAEKQGSFTSFNMKDYV